ncbi:transcription repressor OFP8-like [Lolium rigidum]|uniref:transcription repressor OFP8-like n=1 Tax=Lolium rigidum TaxID=89674 RepID=UPI001F5E06DB|nr:transcription repressor OFP8-like [Lolium rigidum]
MLSPGISVKRRHGGVGFAIGCGCKDAKSVSVSASPSPSGAGTSTTTETRRGGGRSTNPSASTTTDTLTSASSSSFVWEDAVAEFGCIDDGGPFKMDSSAAATQSFSGLLRELSELEQSVASWGRKSHSGIDKKPSTPPREARKVTTKSGGDSTKGAKAYHRAGDVVQVAGLDGRVEVGLDGSVAVVKQSEDPLGDFRQSMVQMIVEHGMVAGEELREMLRRFLNLNAPHHHDVILRAFAEIWDAVFAASVDDPVVLSTATATVPTRREPSPARPPVPRTPPRHHHSPSAWRV